jgi:predicted XRE-type DNA-binding protein
VTLSLEKDKPQVVSLKVFMENRPEFTLYTVSSLRDLSGMRERQKDQESKKLVAALKKWALKNNKSQSMIAELLGVDRRRVSNWFKEKDATIPSLEHGIRIQNLLKEEMRRSTATDP